VHGAAAARPDAAEGGGERHGLVDAGAPAAARTPQPPLYAADGLYGVIPADTRKPFDVREVIARIVDGSELDEFKSRYGTTLVTGFARIHGMPVGILANNGILYSESALKGAHFIELCAQRGIPLLFLQNITGFMVGRRAEAGGIARDGAKMVTAVAAAQVPKLTMIIGGSYGAGNYAMCGRAFDPLLTLAWPNSKCSVMGAAQAAGTLLQIDLAARERKGEKVDDAVRAQLLEAITRSYSEQQDIRYAASRGWLDRIIEPSRTRAELLAAVRVAYQAPVDQPFRTGVLQT
jgi:3-methylcrotonyl-CoA carboxylase beta subunit